MQVSKSTLLNLSIAATLLITSCLAAINCHRPAPGAPPPHLSALDCRFLLAQIPSFPPRIFPPDSGEPGIWWNGFEIVLRHESCVLTLDLLEFVSPTLSSAQRRMSGPSYAGLGDPSAMIFNMLGAMRIAGERIVLQCVEGRAWRGSAGVKAAWGSRSTHFRLRVGGLEEKSLQDAGIAGLRSRIEGGGGMDEGPSVGLPGRFSVLYFDV